MKVNVQFELTDEQRQQWASWLKGRPTRSRCSREDVRQFVMLAFHNQLEEISRFPVLAPSVSAPQEDGKIHPAAYPLVTRYQELGYEILTVDPDLITMRKRYASKWILQRISQLTGEPDGRMTIEEAI